MNLAEQLAAAQVQIGALEGERDSGVTALATVTGERDAGVTALEAMTGERDSGVVALEAMTGERDEAVKAHSTVKAQLELSPGHKDLVGQGDAGGGGGSLGADAGDDDATFVKSLEGMSPSQKTGAWNKRRDSGFGRLGLFLLIAFVSAVLSFVGVATSSAKDYDQVILETTAASTSTVATAVADTVVGEVYEVVVAVESGATCDVVVASGDVTIFSKDDCTGTVVYRPRFDTHTSAGVIASSNAVAVLVVDTVTASFDSCSVADKTVSVKLNIRK